jgi:hypothetical protein
MRPNSRCSRLNAALRRLSVPARIRGMSIWTRSTTVTYPDSLQLTEEIIGQDTLL